MYVVLRCGLIIQHFYSTYITEALKIEAKTRYALGYSFSDEFTISIST